MNKNILFSAILLLGIAIQADAKICIGCSAEIPDTASYCGKCMTPQPQSANIGYQNYQKQPREVVLDMFAFIDKYEIYFHDLQYLNILGKMPEVKTMFQNASVRYKNIERMLPEECRILANIYAAKYQLFDGVTSIMKNLRIDSGHRAAILKSALVSISSFNKIIDEFRVDRNWNQENIMILKKQIQNIRDRTQKYQVTSKYLKIDETSVPQGESVMVLAINGKKAYVMYMGPSMTNAPVEAMINLSALEKRTTWKKENLAYFQDMPSLK